MVLVAIPILLIGAVLYAPPSRFLVRDDPKASSDFLVVLGGEDSRARYAARCFHEGVAPRILVTGYGDAYKNRDLLHSLGVPSKVILVEPLSRSTLENARFSAPILHQAGARKVAIVTSMYHTSRAYATFRHEMPGMTFVSLAVDAQTDKRSGDRGHARWEILKRAWYFVRYGVPLF